MAMTINPDECTACGECETVCPTQSIFEKKGVFRINAATCNECVDAGGKPRCSKACQYGCISTL